MRRFLPHEMKILGFYKTVEKHGTLTVEVPSETLVWRLKAKCGVLVKLVNREYERDNKLMDDAKRAVDSVGLRVKQPTIAGAQWGLEFYRRADEPDLQAMDNVRIKHGEGEYDPVEDAGAKSLEQVLKRIQGANMQEGLLTTKPQTVYYKKGE